MSVMSRGEFVRRAEICARRRSRNDFIALSIFVVSVVIGLVFAKTNGRQPDAGLVGLAIMGAPAFLRFAWAGRRQRGFERSHGLSCPSCGKLLIPIKSVVIASRHCGFCGDQVCDH